MTGKYTLYGAPLSLYTGKTRAYLTYKKIPFNEVFSSLKVYKKIIIPNTGVRFIPVLKTPSNTYIQDTTAIMENLELQFPERSVTPKSAIQQLVSEVFQIWGDEWLLIPAMHYRWNHDNFPFIHEEFGKVIMPNMPAFIRRIVGKKVGKKFKGFVPVLGITPNSIPAIEDWYENHVLVELDNHFSKYNYLLGDRPCAGDFGLIGPLYAHLYRDPAPGALMKQKAPNVVKWVERMNTCPDSVADWNEDGVIPDSLYPLLARIFNEFWPVLLSTVTKAQEWVADNPQTLVLPRTIGEHEYKIGNASEKRAILTFHLWKFQRVVDLYERFNTAQKSQINTAFQEQLGLTIESVDLGIRVTRKNNKLELDR